MKNSHSLDACLKQLLSLHPKYIDLSLDRMHRLLAKLGHPEKNLPPTIHIAGTNGKGSVLSFLHHMLSRNGYRVQAYSSPHLVRFTERICLNGKEIDDESLLQALYHCLEANQGAEITFFEITSCAAFKIFSEHTADILLLETGLGGRLDATHMVEKPLVTVLTPISMDHQEFLGDSLEKIAFEKASIQKPYCPSFIARQHPEAMNVIEDIAHKNNIPLFRHGQEWRFSKYKNGLWDFHMEQTVYRALPPPNLIGAHQYDNAALALSVIHYIQSRGFPIMRSELDAGLCETFWPARLQALSTKKYGFCDQIDLWLDGGHNRAAAEILGTQLQKWQEKPIDLVVGMMNNRDVENFLAPLLPFITTLNAVPIPGQENSHSPDYIAGVIREKDVPARAFSSPQSAFAALQQEKTARHILICGSLYLAGYILSPSFL